MFNLESITENPSVDEKIREIVKRQYKTAEALLNDITKRLGEGMTAEVCFLASNDKLCLKIYKREVEMVEGIYFLSPADELFIQNKVRSINCGVRVPKVYCAFKDNETEDGLQYILMERLNAVSIDDVFTGREKLPEAFDFDKFSVALKKFLEEMHGFDVYHRDLHEGNIMIDKVTGMPYVIDFGASTEFYGEGNPYEITKGNLVERRTSDEGMVKKVLERLRKLTINK
ncbi:MAG: AarF/UbiB family protein [Candidatus Paceibacterota bacterium]|jgi:serine/threonine protein kinase